MSEQRVFVIVWLLSVLKMRERREKTVFFFVLKFLFGYICETKSAKRNQIIRNVLPGKTYTLTIRQENSKTIKLEPKGTKWLQFMKQQQRMKANNKSTNENKKLSKELKAAQLKILVDMMMMHRIVLCMREAIPSRHKFNSLAVGVIPVGINRLSVSRHQNHFVRQSAPMRICVLPFKASLPSVWVFFFAFLYIIIIIVKRWFGKKKLMIFFLVASKSKIFSSRVSLNRCCLQVKIEHNWQLISENRD